MTHLVGPEGQHRQWTVDNHHMASSERTEMAHPADALAVLLANAAHDLRTPLTVISGFAEMLLNADALDPESRDVAVQSIYRRSRDMMAIIDRLEQPRNRHDDPEL